MTFSKDLGSLLGILIISVSIFNFTLKRFATINPEFMEIIAGSTKLERFAEALGYYHPVAVDDVATIQEDAGTTFIDVLNNDGDGDRDTLYLTSTSTTDPIDATRTGTNDGLNGSVGIGSNRLPAGSNPTGGEVELTLPQNFQGLYEFSYDVCDSQPPVDQNTPPPPVDNTYGGWFYGGGIACFSNVPTEYRFNQSGTVQITVEARNDLPQVQSFGVSLEQDGEYSFTLPEFEGNFQDPDQVFLDANPSAQSSPNEGYTLQSIGLLSLPQYGTLYLENTEITGARTFTAQEAATLRYVPNPGYFGSDRFGWYANDGIANSFISDSIELQTQQDASTQSFSPVAEVNLTINQRQTPQLEPLSVPTQTITVRRGETVESVPIVSATDPSGSVTGVTLSADKPEFCMESNPGQNGNILTCTAPIDAPLGEITFSVTAADSLNRTVTETLRVVVEDYLVPTVVLTSDTPPEAVEIGKEVCVTATITNNNNYSLNDVVARLTTVSAKAAFVEQSARILSPTQSTSAIVEAPDQITFTIPTLAAGEILETQTCVLPKVTDLSVVDGTAFVMGSDKTSRDEVELNPPAQPTVTTNSLPRTGGRRWTGTIIQLTVLWGFLTALVWIYWRMRQEEKQKTKNP